MKIVRKDKRTALEKEIDRMLRLLSLDVKDSAEYYDHLALLERLYDLKGDKEKPENKLSPDTIAIVVGNLLGIVLILGYEKANIITTKALSFVLKGRV